MINFTDNLYKLTNTATGENIYCITLTDACLACGISQASRYSMLPKGKWKEWLGKSNKRQV